MTSLTTSTASTVRNAVRAALAAALVAGAALSANAMPLSGGSHVEEALTVMQQRFESADSNHDGRISREDARDRMPFVYRNFDAIDTEHRGYVTLPQIEAYAARQGMQHRGMR